MVARDPLDERERAGADGRLAEVVVGQVGLDVDAVKLVKQWRIGRLQPELDGGVIDDVDLVDDAEVGGARRTEVLVENTVEGELDVFGFEVLAVVELDAGAQMEGIGQAVGGDVPAGGQSRHHAVKGWGGGDKGLVHLLLDLIGNDGDGLERVDGVDLAVEAHREHAASLGRLGRSQMCSRCTEQSQEERRAERKGAPGSSHGGLPPFYGLRATERIRVDGRAIWAVSTKVVTEDR